MARRRSPTRIETTVLCDERTAVSLLIDSPSRGRLPKQLTRTIGLWMATALVVEQVVA